MVLFSFFFSSRRRHTRYWRDWSSDVCSSDLRRCPKRCGPSATSGTPTKTASSTSTSTRLTPAPALATAATRTPRSEERRVGKECRTLWSPYHLTKERGTVRKEKENTAKLIQ